MSIITTNRSRNHEDWLKAYMDYAKYSEAPIYMHFWTGVSVVAAALRRKVWLDQVFFRWYPNFYIIFVAPPAVVAKSTTANIGYKLLDSIPGINLGPDIVTWQSLVTTFANCQEEFRVDDVIHRMSAISLVSSELGNLLNPSDKKMVDLLIKLWDAESVRKETKRAGVEVIENSWINILACTTPAWIASNMSETMIKGGLTSRCLFVYASKKAQLIAYPNKGDKIRTDYLKKELISDLKVIAKLKGEYRLTKEAYEWGKEWYIKHSNANSILNDARFGGYLNRKQSHIHKLAIVIAASQSNELIINQEQLELASIMVSDLEADLMKVFTGVGKDPEKLHIDQFLTYCQQRGSVQYASAFMYMTTHLPKLSDPESVLVSLIKDGYIKLNKINGVLMIDFIKKPN